MKRTASVLGAAVAMSLSLAPAWADKSPISVDLQADGFEQIARERGVTVYKNRKSSIIHVGAEGRFPAPPRAVQRALLDYASQVGRIERLSEARVLSQTGDSLLVYQRLNLPVIDDRDFTLKVRQGSDGSTRWVAYRTAAGRGPAQRDGVVRVTHHRGVWQLEPASGGQATRVRFETSIDLGGSLPKWMARAGAGKELPALFGAICRLSVPPSEQSQCP